MLAVTENARTIVKQITETSAPEITALRIASESASEAATPSFAITAVTAPQPGDETVEDAGATIHLDAGAAQELDDKILDAAVDQAGGVQFSIAPQA